MKRISILGSTGSIGTQVLDVVAMHPDKFSVVGLAEGHDPQKLIEQIRRFRPKVVSVRDEAAAKVLKGMACEVRWGLDGASQVASLPEADLVVSAIVGSAGLKPTWAAIEAGKDVALANKETLVAAGSLVTRRVQERGVKLIPIDSEHSALFQSLIGHNHNDVRRLILTASGGPFRNRSVKELEGVTRDEALRHPNWAMGPKITIDSATMMNKGLEVIEARWLFDMPLSKIEVVIHPQSIIHSMVEYVDGAVIAQMANPDMRIPIAYALGFPERLTDGAEFVDFTNLPPLTFEAPDTRKFRLLALAYDAARAGGSMPTVLNAANEVAVEAFLKGRIKFLDIARVVEETINSHDQRPLNDINDVFEWDMWAREQAGNKISES